MYKKNRIKNPSMSLKPLLKEIKFTILISISRTHNNKFVVKLNFNFKSLNISP